MIRGQSYPPLSSHYIETQLPLREAISLASGHTVMASDKRVFKPKPRRLKCLVFSISKRTHVECHIGEDTIMCFILHPTQHLSRQRCGCCCPPAPRCVPDTSRHTWVMHEEPACGEATGPLGQDCSPRNTILLGQRTPCAHEVSASRRTFLSVNSVETTLSTLSEHGHPAGY